MDEKKSNNNKCKVRVNKQDSFKNVRLILALISNLT